MTNTQAQMLPTGYAAVMGVSSITYDGNVMTIAVAPVGQARIDWAAFDIGSSQKVHIEFSRANTVLVNQVMGNAVSQIAGELTSTGGGVVRIDNEAGLQFSSGAQINLEGGFWFSGQGALVLGGGTVGGNLTVQTAGSLTQVGAIRVLGTSDLIASSITLLDEANTFGGAVSMSSSGIAEIAADGSLRFGTLDVVNLLSASADTVYLPQSLTTVGGQSYSGSLVLQGDTSLTATLGGLGLFGRLEGPHALSLQFGGTVSLGDAVDIGSLDSRATETQLTANITTVGDIDLNNTTVIGNVALVSMGSSVQINGSVNGFHHDTDSLSITAYEQIALQNAVSNSMRLRDLSLNAGSVSTLAVEVGNRLSIESGASISPDGAYQVGGTARFVSDGNITLLNSANAFGGDVELNGSNVQIAALGLLTLSGVDANLLHATAIGQLIVRNANVVSSTTLVGNVVALNGVALGLNAEINATGGNITQQGSVRVDGQSNWTAVGDVLLENASNQFGGAVTAQGRVVSLATAGALNAASVHATGLAKLAGGGVQLGSVQAGSLQVDSSGDIGQGVALQVAGDSRFVAIDDITLGNAGNQFGGGVQLAGQGVHIASAGRLRLDGVVVGGDLTAAAHGGSIGQTGSVQVQGRSDMTARDDIILQTTGNTFGGAVALDASTITFQIDSSLQVDGLQTRNDGSAWLQAGGDLTLDGDAIDLGAGALLANARAGQLTSRTALAGGAVVLQGRDGVTVEGDITAGQVVLTSTDGDVLQQAGRIQASGPSAVVSNNGDIGLDNTGNRFDDTLQLIGRDIRVAAEDLQLNGVRADGDLQLNSSGSIVQQQQLQVYGNADLRAVGDITLLHASNRFASSLSLSGVNMQLHSDEDVTLWRADGQDLSLNGDGVFLIPFGATISTDSVGLKGGHLQVRGALANALTVESGATVSGDGAVGQLVAKSQAQVEPGVDAAHAGVLTAQAFRAEPDAVLRIHAQDPAAVSRLQVNGPAQLDGRVQLVSQSTLPSGRFRIIESTQAIQGAFAGLTVVPALPAETVSLLIHEDQVVSVLVAALSGLETEGADQSAAINQAFADPLVVRVLNEAGEPVEGISVEFSTPATGAGAVLSQTLAVTNADGEASVTATANGETGQYVVTARVQGQTESVSFALENTLHEAVLTLTTTPTQPLEGDEITVEVQLQSEADTAPTGTVDVSVAGNIICLGVELVQASAQCVLPKEVSLAKSTAVLEGAKTAKAVIAGQTIEIVVQYSGDALHQSAEWTTQLGLSRHVALTPVPWNAPWALLSMAFVMLLSARQMSRRR